MCQRLPALATPPSVALIAPCCLSACLLFRVHSMCILRALSLAAGRVCCDWRPPNLPYTHQHRPAKPPENVSRCPCCACCCLSVIVVNRKCLTRRSRRMHAPCMAVRANSFGDVWEWAPDAYAMPSGSVQTVVAPITQPTTQPTPAPHCLQSILSNRRLSPLCNLAAEFVLAHSAPTRCKYCCVLASMLHYIIDGTHCHV
jgi:hypothetical protein